MKVIWCICFFVVWMMLYPVNCFCQKLEEVYTSSGSITGITALADGTIFVGTRGGVLSCEPGGAWRKYTILDRLPDNEVLSVDQQNGSVLAYTVRGAARLDGNRWISDPELKPKTPLLDGQICSTKWMSFDCVSIAEGLRIRINDAWKPIPMPQSKGTHISALFSHGKELWSAFYDDGIFAWNGKRWKPVSLTLPVRVREITAMISIKNRFWIGTNADGIWSYDGETWKQHTIPDEPWDHNCQDIELYKGDLYASTLDSGLIMNSKNGWQQIKTPQISSNTPRQIIPFDGKLYLRHSLGVVDRFDGRIWMKNVLGTLPRKQCSALAVDESRLYAGQWGGWSELAGSTWMHHLSIPELQGFQITAILPDDDRLWIGTQGLGLVQINRVDGALKLHNEFLGMPDDTIKCLVCSGNAIYAGTFSQGLAWMNKTSDKWTSVPELIGSQVTCLKPDRSGGVYVGARTGLWYCTSGNKMTCVMRDIEVQSLVCDDDALWVGTRTGLLKFALSK